MASRTEDREGKIFIGCLMLGVGAGFIISIITDNWIYMAPGAVIGLGLGFIGMAIVSKK